MQQLYAVICIVAIEINHMTHCKKKILRDEICHIETHMLAIVIINAVKSFNLELILKSNYIQDCLGIS